MKEEANTLVSCIMPTYNRRAFVPYAIQYFLRQDYSYKELIILDDGEDSVEDLVPADPAIRYYRLEKKISLGAKLNLACGYARGHTIAHWDDDDWYAAHRLSCQVAALQKNAVCVTGINQLLYWDLTNKRSLKYIYPAGQRPWLAGSSLCYKKSFWEDNKFADINVGMDGLFVSRAKPETLCVLTDSTFAVHLIHQENGSPKDTSGVWWQDYPVAEIKTLMQEDFHTYSNGNLYLPDRQEPFHPLRPEADEGGRLQNPFATHTKNVFVCLVHESKDCILDMIRNLQYYDPASLILLYNGSENSDLLETGFLKENPHVFIYPNPSPVKHGYLHTFALDCMQFALDNFSFTTFTIVDSDQLLLRKDYSGYVNRFFNEHPGTGLLSCHPQKIGVQNEHYYVASEALKEFALWKPLLESFPGGLNKFVYWTFWPSTVFSIGAIRDLVKLFTENKLLKNIMQETKIWATEEVIFPTLVSLLGYEIAGNPCDYEYVQYKVSHKVNDIASALEKPAVFWVHPVERIWEDPLRKYIRDQSAQYVIKKEPLSKTGNTALTGLQKILESADKINGWLYEKEADLLMATLLKACIDFRVTHKLVEIGSYQGKSTLLLAGILKAFFPDRKLYAIDPHDGILGATDVGLQCFPPTFERLTQNIQAAGLTDFVEIIRDYTCNVKWQQPLAFLFVDGLHDYQSVSGDFAHFSPWLSPGAYIAFHDYADYYPGVTRLVNELLERGQYRKMGQEKSLIVVQKVG